MTERRFLIGYPPPPVLRIVSKHAGLRDFECALSVLELLFSIACGQNIGNKALSSGAGGVDRTTSALTMFRRLRFGRKVRCHTGLLSQTDLAFIVHRRRRRWLTAGH